MHDHPTRWGWIEHPASLGDWKELVDEHVAAGPLRRPPRRTSYTEATRPLERIFYLARMAGCQTVLIENRYVDADYRSEYGRHWSRTFEGRPAFARRLHFFRAWLTDRDVANLPDPKDAGYIGYSVMRPTPQGPVGRTMVTAPAWLSSGLTDRNEVVDPETGLTETRRNALLARPGRR